MGLQKHCLPTKRGGIVCRVHGAFGERTYTGPEEVRDRDFICLAGSEVTMDEAVGRSAIVPS